MDYLELPMQQSFIGNLIISVEENLEIECIEAGQKYFLEAISQTKAQEKM